LNRTFEEMMKNIGEQVIKLTNDSLTKHSQKVLGESQEKCLKSLIIDLSSKTLHENSVYKLLCKFNIFLLCYIIFLIFFFNSFTVC
jgi:hypothetical protein